jgi:hypothetical protein
VSVMEVVVVIDDDDDGAGDSGSIAKAVLRVKRCTALHYTTLHYTTPHYIALSHSARHSVRISG